MIEYYLMINPDGSLNNGKLSVFVDGAETVLIEPIVAATKKGWESTKKIFEELDIIEEETDCDLIITESCAKMLLAKYGDVKVKRFETYESKKRRERAVGDLAWCSVIKDPHDIG